MSSRICKTCRYSAKVSGVLYCKHFEPPELGGAGFSRLSVGCTTPEQCVEMGLHKPKQKPSAPTAMTVRRGKSPADAWRCQQQITRKAERNRTYKPRSDLDEAKARALYNAGQSDGQIAEACGASKSCVQRWRNRNGLESRGTAGRMPVYDHEGAVMMMLNGASDRQIADRYGVEKSTVKKLREKRNIPNTRQIQKGV